MCRWKWNHFDVLFSYSTYHVLTFRCGHFYRFVHCTVGRMLSFIRIRVESCKVSHIAQLIRWPCHLMFRPIRRSGQFQKLRAIDTTDDNGRMSIVNFPVKCPEVNRNNTHIWHSHLPANESVLCAEKRRWVVLTFSSKLISSLGRFMNWNMKENECLFCCYWRWREMQNSNKFERIKLCIPKLSTQTPNRKVATKSNFSNIYSSNHFRHLRFPIPNGENRFTTTHRCIRMSEK